MSSPRSTRRSSSRSASKSAPWSGTRAKSYPTAPSPLQVPIREFKSRLSHYLEQARAGYEVLAITSHRKIVARVTGVHSDAGEGIAGLIASGAVSWGGGKPAGAAIRLTKQSQSVSDLVLEDRG